MYNAIELNNKLVDELKTIAQKLTVENFDSLTKQDLIFAIIEKQGNSGIVAAPEPTETKKEARPRAGRSRKVKETAAPVDKETMQNDAATLFTEPVIPVEEPVVFHEPVVIPIVEEINVAEKSVNTDLAASEGVVKSEISNTKENVGKVRASQGFFTVERTCPTCGGAGQTIKNPCKTCHGAGRVEKERQLSVNIPAGVETGTRIRLAGEGEAGLRGGPSGDLYIFIEVREHALYPARWREPFLPRAGGDDHRRDRRLSRGADDRRRPQPGEGSRGDPDRQADAAQGQGDAGAEGRGIGDMLIEVAVETPVNLTSRQRELLREFERLSEDNNPEGSSFFSKVRHFWDGMKG